MNGYRLLVVSSDTGELRQSVLADPHCFAGWKLETAGSTESALLACRRRPFDALVVDAEFGTAASLGLLNWIAGNKRETIRFVCGDPADTTLLEESLRHSHRVFTSIPDAATLRDTIRVAAATQEWLLRYHDSLGGLVPRMRMFPSPPTLYFKVLAELKSAHTSVERIAELIQTDFAVTTRLIQLVNLVGYGRRQAVTSLADAIQILGLETVKSQVLAVQAVVRLDDSAESSLGTEQIWKHASAVAERARRIALYQTRDRTVADQAFTAGLLHDLGRLLFASNFPAEYTQVLEQARRMNQPLVELERQLLGISHVEAGAYLAALWGLPAPVVSAIGWHLEPCASNDAAFTPLTALHAANAFEHGDTNANPPASGYELSTDYLQRIGCAEAVESWKTAPAVSPREVSRATTASKTKNTRVPARKTGWLPGLLAACRDRRCHLATSSLLAVAGLFLARESWVRIRRGEDGLFSPQPIPVSGRTLLDESAPLGRQPPPTVTKITILGASRTAVINGVPMREGDVVQGVTVVEIKSESVRIRSSSGETTLPLRASEPTDAELRACSRKAASCKVRALAIGLDGRTRKPAWRNWQTR